VTRHIRTEIEIAASADRVWQILTDFTSYPEWNPFITRIAGQLAVGSRLDAFLQPPGSRGIGFKPTVVALVPGRELQWLGKLLSRGVFDGEHSFRIEPLTQERVRFIQEERFSGILTFPPLFRVLTNGTQEGFTAMNQALKQRAEAPEHPGPHPN